MKTVEELEIIDKNKKNKAYWMELSKATGWALISWNDRWSAIFRSPTVSGVYTEVCACSLAYMRMK